MLLKSLSQSERDQLTYLVLQQLTHQAKKNFMKNEKITLGMIIKLIELTIATLTESEAAQASVKLELDQLKLELKLKTKPGTDQIELDMFNAQQL